MYIKTLPITSIYRPVDTATLNDFQKDLDGKGIPLNCLSPAKITQPNVVNSQEISDYLATVADKPRWHTLKKKLFDHIDCIKFQDLQNGLASCCGELNKLLDNKDYIVGFVPQKSQKWIAELALPLLNKPPKGYFLPHCAQSYDHATGIKTEQRQCSLYSSNRDMVIFDDASYSGTQISETILKLKEGIINFKNETFHLYLVIPFISSIAENRLKFATQPLIWQKDVDSTPGKIGKLKVHLLTTDRKIKAMTEVFSDSEIVELMKIEDFETGLGRYTYMEGTRFIRCLTFPEWKTPDNISVPRSMKRWKKGEKTYEFITEFPAPYKVIIGK